jgi:hypothetical protein
VYVLNTFAKLQPYTLKASVIRASAPQWVAAIVPPIFVVLTTTPSSLTFLHPHFAQHHIIPMHAHKNTCVCAYARACTLRGGGGDGAGGIAHVCACLHAYVHALALADRSRYSYWQYLSMV